MDVETNDLGGVNQLDKEAVERAKKMDLLTFEKGISGTNCFNCRWIRNKRNNIGYCSNERVKQYVNQRMCCAVWDSKDSYRPYKK